MGEWANGQIFIILPNPNTRSHKQKNKVFNNKFLKNKYLTTNLSPMAKEQSPRKSEKKVALKTPAEKKAEKRDKKNKRGQD